jgi:hypothetical protein
MNRRLAMTEALTFTALTKNGITKLGGPRAFDPPKFKTDKKITDEEILAILEQPVNKNAGAKPKTGKKKPAGSDGKSEANTNK